MTAELNGGEIPDGVDVIIRIHDSAMIADLDRALFSLFNQSYRWVRPVVVTQGFEGSDLERVEKAVNQYAWRSRGTSAIVHNVPNPGKADIRARLLNVGISLASSRYLAFLDCDDYMYSHAYSWLIEALSSRHAGIAFGGIAIKHVRDFSSHHYTFSKDLGPYAHPTRTWLDLLDENFCPIHSFLVDRRVVDDEHLLFNERVCRLEDYGFLLEVCSRYPSVFSSMEKIIGAYIWKSDGTNSTCV